MSSHCVRCVRGHLWRLRTNHLRISHVVSLWSIGCILPFISFLIFFFKKDTKTTPVLSKLAQPVIFIGDCSRCESPSAEQQERVPLLPFLIRKEEGHLTETRLVVTKFVILKRWDPWRLSSESPSARRIHGDESSDLWTVSLEMSISIQISRWDFRSSTSSRLKRCGAQGFIPSFTWAWLS